ncbi:methyl-viologen-reducing hydrogenase subunit delta [candidate division WOR-3 bacterium]|uniref:Methyl-viologen-reducing hydrogenase subunit delta n=1 Tax=candidate division WOR-3 bacterium TaxID=2052148 RepID=A0A660SJW5_UNCW3|nr:MAG: methyl-viologen-reducing hydrogenase subunit delta [candidate division WOR-3 bacterium]
MSDFLPRIVGFLCNWCSYAGADLAGVSRLKMPPALIPIRVMCSSRVDPLFVLRAFLGGADAVLIAGCHPGDCHYQSGNYYTRRRFALLQRIFQELGLEVDRLRLAWIAASEGVRFKKVVTEYTDRIKKLGPNPVKKEIFL